MTRVNRLLLLALVAQIAILLVIQLMPTGPRPDKPRKLFGPERLSPATVTRLRIVGQEKKIVELEKRGSSWVLKSAGGYPALGNKVTDLLGKLPTLIGGQPVAEKALHHRALEVAAESFQREITISQPGKADLVFYLGSAAGLKDVHLRFAGEEAVYVVKDLSAWDAGTSAADWVSTEYFKVERDRVVALEIQNAEGELKLSKGADGKWVLADLEEGAKLKESEVDSLLGSACSVALQEPVGEREEARFGLDKPAATLTLVTEAQREKEEKGKKEESAGASPPAAERTQHVLRIGVKEGDAYYARSSGSRFVVRLGSWAAETLLKKKAADLVEKEKEKRDGETKGASPADSTPPPAADLAPPADE
jgi:hypothetical protein